MENTSLTTITTDSSDYIVEESVQKNIQDDLLLNKSNQNDNDILENPVERKPRINILSYNRSCNGDDINDIPIGMVGLLNLGNTCYMNSILQCLFNINSFQNIFVDNHIIKYIYPNVINQLSETNKNNISVIWGKTQCTLTYQMHKLISTVWADVTKIISPNNFRILFGKKIQNFQSYQHQDSQEALICILDTIHIELEEQVNIDYNFIPESYLDKFQEINKQELSDIDICLLEDEYPDIYELFSIKRALDSFNKKSYSVITKLFQNVISSTLQCPKCNFHTYNFDPTNIIIVQIPTNNSSINMKVINDKINKLGDIDDNKKSQIRQYLISKQLQNNNFTLDECFNQLTQVERLDDSEKWMCPNCEVKVNALKQLNIWLPSKIMIVLIKRFMTEFINGEIIFRKLDNLIEFPIEDFNISPYLSNLSKQIGNFTYDLVAISNQIGRLEGGHYYSYIKSMTDGNWYCLDDDNIKPISIDDIITPNAYILFYKLRE